MKLKLLIPFIFFILFLITDIAVFSKMMSLIKKNRYDTVEKLSNKLNFYLNASCVVTVFMAICMALVIIMKYMENSNL